MSGSRTTVVHLLATNFYGGPERQVVEQSVRLDRASFRPVIGSWREGRHDVEVTREAARRGIETFLVETPRPWDPRAVRELARRLHRAGADLVVCHGYKADLHGHFACRILGVPRVTVLRGLTGENFRVRFYERLYRWSLARADRVVAVSRATARLARELGAPAERVGVIPNAWYPPREGLEARDPRREHGFPAEEPVLAAAGRLSPEKGQDVLVDALARLARRGIPFRAVLYGEGPLRPGLEETIREGGLAGRVLLAGFRRDARNLLAGADLVVNPSRSEGMPNVLLEAMAAGTPVVATAVGGVPEMLEDGRSAWLVPPGDPEVLAGALAAALADPVERRRRAAAARATLEERFAAETLVRRWETLYREMVPAPAPGEREGKGR